MVRGTYGACRGRRHGRKTERHANRVHSVEPVFETVARLGFAFTLGKTKRWSAIEIRCFCNLQVIKQIEFSRSIVFVYITWSLVIRKEMIVIQKRAQLADFNEHEICCLKVNIPSTSSMYRSPTLGLSFPDIRNKLRCNLCHDRVSFCKRRVFLLTRPESADTAAGPIKRTL